MSCTRFLRPLLAAGLLLLASASPAFGHAAFLASDPQPGVRLEAPPQQIALTFTEPLNRTLTTAKLIAVADGAKVPVAAAGVSERRLLLRPAEDLRRGAYRVEWHSVSTEDGHALEGSFSFGVRAAAAGGQHSVEQSPLARGGWLRVTARMLLYVALLLFAGALLLRVMLNGHEGSWLVPPDVEDAGVDTVGLRRRADAIVGDVGVLAAVSAILAALVEAADAAQGFSPSGLSSFLLGNAAGIGRVAVVALAFLALAVWRRRPAIGAVLAVFALGAVAASGHASSASPRAFTVLNDWVHLVGGAVWLGGIGLIVLVWGPTLRRAERPARMAVARHVLPRFGRVALAAFAVVSISGVNSLLAQLSAPSDLVLTAYGRVLLVKIALVVLIAAASWWHAMRLRPRIVRAAGPVPRMERRHWRLLRAEPIVGLGVVGAVALLATFPLPPRQLSETDEALAAVPACDPCPLERPAADELAVADNAGSRIVAGWLRRDGERVTGTIRLLDYKAKPTEAPIAIDGARAKPCGPGCRRFTVRTDVVRVAVRERGRQYVALLPARWARGESGKARTLLRRAQAAMRELRSVRQLEDITSGPGSFARTHYRLAAPDRMTYAAEPAGSRAIIVGERQWVRYTPEMPWEARAYGSGIPFSTRSWFRWTGYAQEVRLLARWRERGSPMAELALMDPGTPAWIRLIVELDSMRVIRETMIAGGHYMTTRYSAFNELSIIKAPKETR
ncbi:MAG: CopD family protein [Solirubrobacteraceae bacterium]